VLCQLATIREAHLTALPAYIAGSMSVFQAIGRR